MFSLPSSFFNYVNESSLYLLNSFQGLKEIIQGLTSQINMPVSTYCMIEYTIHGILSSLCTVIIVSHSPPERQNIFGLVSLVMLESFGAP